MNLFRALYKVERDLATLRKVSRAKLLWPVKIIFRRWHTVPVVADDGLTYLQVVPSQYFELWAPR